MDQWAVVVADSVLLVTGVGGAVITGLRMRRLGVPAGLLAGAGCAVLVLGALFDLVWRLRVQPAAIDRQDYESAASLSDAGVLTFNLSVAVAVALLLAAVHVARPKAPAGGPAQPPAAAGPPQAQPTAGWTPPRQAQPADWSYMSGVWSMPPGALDEPPSGQRAAPPR